MTRITCGLKCDDGLTRIVITEVPNDMGDSGRPATRLKEKFVFGRELLFGRFIWANKKNGNMIYKQINKEEYFKQEENKNNWN